MNVGAAPDGGVVVALFFMAGAIAFAICSTVALYESSTREKGNHARLLRLLSGWANVSNSFIHVLLTIYMLSNAANDSEYWIEERKLGGIEGPVGLTVLNFLAGLSALRGYSSKFPLVWNTFVAAAGTFIPVVWLRFLKVGLKEWPHEVIFIWFCIFFFELTAVTCSVGHVAIVRNDYTDSSKEKKNK